MVGCVALRAIWNAGSVRPKRGQHQRRNRCERYECANHLWRNGLFKEANQKHPNAENRQPSAGHLNDHRRKYEAESCKEPINGRSPIKADCLIHIRIICLPVLSRNYRSAL